MMAQPKLRLEEVVITRGVLARTAIDRDFATFVWHSLARHADGDWGELPPEDWLENEFALGKELRILSAYERGDMPKIWITTEADRSVTTILFPEES